MQKAASLLVLIALATLLLYLRFPDFFAHGNSRFIEPWGDGYKAYHAIFYHIDHDSTASHFEGMNYPYGEHVVPGACQPFFSNGMRALQSIGLDLRPYGLGIFHGFLLLGLVLSAVFLYLVFVRLQVARWYAMLLALGLTALAPQLERFISHYGLAHPELLPMLFYLLLRWHESMASPSAKAQRKSWWWSLGIGLLVLVYSGIHFYYFAILSFAIFGWVAVHWLWQKDWPATLAYLGHGLIMLGLPFLFYFAWMLYPDTVTDRNPVPWGFFNYRSRPAGILSDSSQPYWQWINEKLSLPQLNMEGLAYIGLVALGFLVVILWRTIKRLPAPQPTTAAHSSYLKYSLVSGLLILLFAFGLPFILPFGKKLLAYAGPIQQFRSIGRFAWVFFYAVNISAFYYIFHWARQQKQTGMRMLILLFPVLVLFYEAYNYCTAKPIDLDVVENWEPGESFLDRGIDYSRFQACLPAPYFNIGSDNFWRPAKGWIGQKTHTLSLQAGLPLTSAMLTRTSLRQTINQLQLVSEPYRMPAVFEDYPNDKPLLLFWDDARVKEHGDTYTHLREGAKALYINDWLHLYELPLHSFQDRIQQRVDSLTAQLDRLHTRPGDNYLASDSTAQFLHLSYDEQPHADAYQGSGEFRAPMGYWNRLVDTVWQSTYTGELSVSFWMYVNSDRAARATISWKEYDAESGEEVFVQERAGHQTARVFDDQGWALMEFNLPRQRANSRIELIVRNEDQNEGDLRVDELLIKPLDLQLGQRLVDGVWWNNRLYPSDL